MPANTYTCIHNYTRPLRYAWIYVIYVHVDLPSKYPSNKNYEHITRSPMLFFRDMLKFPCTSLYTYTMDHGVSGTNNYICVSTLWHCVHCGIHRLLFAVTPGVLHIHCIPVAHDVETVSETVCSATLKAPRKFPGPLQTQ